ncbi:MAG: ATP-binding protein, partial [Bacteroidales bacterium]|nr:ATP-binding protein [Bacteroidales bacterium]
FNILKSKEVINTGLMKYVKKAYSGQAVDVPMYKFDPTGETEAQGKGRVRWLNSRIYPLKNQSGRVYNIVVVHQDVSDQKIAEIDLSKSQKRLINAQRIAQMGDFTWNVNTGEITWSEGLYNLLKYTKDEKITIDLINNNIYHPDDLEMVMSWLNTSIESGQNELTPYEYRVICKDSEIIHVRTQGIIERQGESVTVFATIQNISKQKQAEALIKESESNLKSLINNTNDSIWSLDKNFKYINFNKAYSDFFVNHYGVELKKGMDAKRFLNPAEFEFWVPLFESVLLGEKKSFEFSHTFNDVPNYYQTSLNPIYEDDVITGVSAMSVDITRIRKAEQDISISNKRYKNLFNESPVPLWEEDYTELFNFLISLKEKGIKDLRSFLVNNRDVVIKCARMIKILNVNQAAVNLHNAKSKEQLIERLDFTFTENSVTTFIEVLLAITAGKEVFESEAEVKTLTGESRYIFLKLKVDHSEQNQHKALLATMDITERKNAEQMLQIQAKELNILNTIGNTVGSTLSFNQVTDLGLKAIRKALRVDAVLFFMIKDDNLVLEKIETGNLHYLNEDKERHCIGRCLCGLAISKDKSVFSIDIKKDGRCTLKDCKLSGLTSIAVFPLRGGENVIGCITIGTLATRNFEQQKTFLETLMGELSSGLYNALLYKQITAYSNDLEQLVNDRTKQLQSANKELEAFVYSVSHDLKAPLRGIEGYSKLLDDTYKNQLDDEAKLFIHNIRSSTLKMNQLINDLLEYSRLERSQIILEEVNIRDFIQSIVNQFSDQLEKGNYDVQVLVGDLMIRVDAKGLSIALRNLVENAIKFSKESKDPCIKLSVKDNISSWIISVNDNGIGFDMKYHKKIYEIFQRLHRAEDYPGTGIGLAMVSKTMQKMNGKTWAEGVPNQGSTFNLEIPKTTENE